MPEDKAVLSRLDASALLARYQDWIRREHINAYLHGQ
jgi:hypothetical protein